MPRTRCTKNSKSDVCYERNESSRMTLHKAGKVLSKNIANSSDKKVKELVHNYQGVGKQVIKLADLLKKAKDTCETSGYASRKCQQTALAQLKRVEKYEKLINKIIKHKERVDHFINYYTVLNSDAPRGEKVIRNFKLQLDKVLDKIDKKGLNATVVAQIRRLESGRYVKQMDKLLA